MSSVLQAGENEATTIEKHDALLLVDVQNDFLPGGSLAVHGADSVLPLLNRYARLATQNDLPILLTRHWHPAAHCSFRERGGPWAPHCLAGTEGAAFAGDLEVPSSSAVISKGTDPNLEANSGFQGTDLEERLRLWGIERLLVAGLATEYGVLETVRDALSLGFRVMLLVDAVCAVDVRPGDGARALSEMFDRGAQLQEFGQLERRSRDQPPA